MKLYLTINFVKVSGYWVLGIVLSPESCALPLCGTASLCSLCALCPSALRNCVFAPCEP